MASSFPRRQGSFQGCDFPRGNIDRDAQGANSSSLTTNSRNLPTSHTYHYPSGIPNGYKMVPAKDGETPRRYVEDNLPVSFYSRKEIKAVFSTNNGEVPTRGLSMNHVLVSRELDLWSAEELQERANAIRKKHWRSLKTMPQPKYWEDLHNYFDCFDIYFHGAQNLWNLILLLFNENENLSRDRFRATAVDIGIWCDEWVIKAENKTKLMAFNCWEDDVVSLITPEVWLELQKLPLIDIMLVRYALCHRQNQLSGKPWARPNAYPANSIEANWYNNTLHCWLAGQLVHDTPSGIPPAVSPSTIIVGGSGSSSCQPSFTAIGGTTAATHMPANTITTPQNPMVVSGTNRKHKAGPHNYGFTARSDSASHSRESFLENRSISLTPVPRNENRITEAPESHITNAGAIKPDFYPHPKRPYGHAFNTPFTTGSNGELQPYYGPIVPSAPPAPEYQQYGPRPPANVTPQRSADNGFPNNGHIPPVQSPMASKTGTRMQSAAYQRVPLDATPSHKHSGKRNATIHSASDQGPRQGLSTGPPRFNPGQSAQQDQLKTPSASNDAGYGQSWPRGETKGWEKVLHADESIHGPVFRRSPTKENRPRSYSRVSSKADLYCSNQHPKNGNKYAYTPCVCMRCEERERSVFSNDSRIREASATDDFVSNELDCMIKIGAMHHSDYGNAMHSDYVQDSGQQGSTKSYHGSQRSIWKGHSNGFGQTQPSSIRRDSRAQVSLEQYMVPRPQPPQAAVRKTQPSAVHSSAAPLTSNVQQRVPQEISGLARDIKSTCDNPEVRVKPAIIEILQTSVEAESQSKPPSEEVIPDEDQTRKISSPYVLESSPGKNGNKAIVVNLPVTPKKPKKADTSTQVSGEITPLRNSEALVTPTKKVSCAPYAANPEGSPLDGQKEFQTATQIAPGATNIIKNNNPIPAQSQSESTSYNKGKYRKVFSLEDDLSVEFFDAPVTRIGLRHNQSAMGSSNVEAHTTEQDDNLRTRAGHQLDDLIDSNRDHEPTPTTIAAEHSTKKKNSKKPKKKKKPASVNQGESSSVQQPTSDALIQVIHITEQQVPETSLPLATETMKDIEPATLREVIAKAKRIVGAKGAESSSAKQSAIDTPAIAVAKALAPPIAETTENNHSVTLDSTKGKEFLQAEDNEPKQLPEKSSVPESISKAFRADGGGSLRLPKNRKKQPTQLHLIGREPSASGDTTGASSFEAPHVFDAGLPSAASTVTFSSTTDQESRSTNGSPVMLSTPATPPPAMAVVATTSSSASFFAAGVEATPKSNTLLNPQAREFVSPSTRPTAAASKKFDLAPVPLKPTKHYRNVSQTSSKTSRTLTPGTSPAKAEDNHFKGNDAETSKGNEKNSASRQGFVMDKDAKGPTSNNKSQGAIQQTSAIKVAGKDKGRSVASDDLSTSQDTPDNNGEWQVQRPKRDFSTKQPKGSSQQKNHQQQQSKHGQQGLKKNRLSPKKQKIQGQSHFQQQRYASSPNTNPVSVDSKAEFPSLPPAPKPVSSLPASSVWGKARSVSTAAILTPCDSTTAHKDETSVNSGSKDGSGQ
ncbi:hypothetical protein CSPAE12_05621 [Colletotrichum incanum]|nr:hypothetical protein CSPAE12_05621 [Colletotrichum incanum]